MSDLNRRRAGLYQLYWVGNEFVHERHAAQNAKKEDLAPGY
jgi:hypothetical protein